MMTLLRVPGDAPATWLPRRLVLVLVFALVAVAVPAPAAAHAQLVGSSPKTDEVLAASPTEVTLEFNEDLIEIGSTLLVVDAAQNNLVSNVELEGRHVRAALAEELSEGSYEVRWRVVSADGHPISGRIPFAVGAPGDPVPAAGEDATSDPEAAEQTTADGPRVPRALVVAVLGAVAGLVLWWAVGGVRSASLPRKGSRSKQRNLDQD